VAAKKGSGEAKESLEVIDVAQLLARSVALQRPPINGTANGGADGSGGVVTADAETGVDAAPPGDVTSAAEGQPTTAADAQATGGNSASVPGTESAGASATSATPPRDADGEAAPNAVEGRAPTFRTGEDGDPSAVTPSEVTGDKRPGDGGRGDDSSTDPASGSGSGSGSGPSTSPGDSPA
jgi:hypothetical protein